MDFNQGRITADSAWRAIILYGANSATYKFAFGRAVLEVAARGDSTAIGLVDIAPRYAELICEALQREPRQGTAKTSKFLDACRASISGDLGKDQLLEITVQRGFINVVEAFPRIGNADSPVRFYEDRTKDRNVRGIVLTDELLDLASRNCSVLDLEADARHKLVETAWATGLNPGLIGIHIEFDRGKDLLCIASKQRRRPVTHVVPALNGYQDGRCAYCNEQMDSEVGRPVVEHVLPFVLKDRGWRFVDVDQVWNLVLSCKDCNSEKSARIPEQEWMPWLARRNEDLIGSNHPLRETLIAQTGKTAQIRGEFLMTAYMRACQELPAFWRPRVRHSEIG